MISSPRGLLILMCAGVLVGIYDDNCNQCVGDPKRLMFSAVVQSKIHARKLQGFL